MDLQIQNAMEQSIYGKLSGKNQQKMDKATQDFESFFVYSMLENMQSGIEVDDNFGGGHAETIFRSMLNEHIAAEVAQKSPFGISDAIQAELLKTQEVKGY